MDYQWYPGHMTKTVRQMQENIKLIDLIIEIVDARIPWSSRNPELVKLGAGKTRMILFGKEDLADEKQNALWLEKYREDGLNPYACDLRKNASLKNFTPVILDACREKIERDRRRGIKQRPIRAMVAGIPNVGKSTFINSFSGRASLKTGNKPGVTKGRQWIRLNSQIELLDTPGILWPKFEDQDIGKKIALIGSIPDANTDPGELAIDLIERLTERYPRLLTERYGVDTADGRKPVEILTAIGEKRGSVRRGGEIDYEKAARLLLDDFRSGRLGRITLESTDEF